jgi:hypothetical protein
MLLAMRQSEEEVKICRKRQLTLGNRLFLNDKPPSRNIISLILPAESLPKRQLNRVRVASILPLAYGAAVTPSVRGGGTR